jgi:hypothetical protein
MEGGLGWVLAAYGVVLGVLAGYAGSLVQRRRRLREELAAARGRGASRPG